MLLQHIIGCKGGIGLRDFSLGNVGLITHVLSKRIQTFQHTGARRDAPLIPLILGRKHIPQKHRQLPGHLRPDPEGIRQSLCCFLTAGSFQTLPLLPGRNVSQQDLEKQYAQTVNRNAFLQIILFDIIKAVSEKTFFQRKNLAGRILRMIKNVPLCLMKIVQIVQINNAVHIKHPQLVS